MYREPHLQCKSDECRCYLVGMERKVWDRDNDSKEAKEARKKWGQCVTEFGEMVSEEVRTNTRYHGIQK